MLTAEMKKEMLADGRSRKRRDDFREGRRKVEQFNAKHRKGDPLEEAIEWSMQIQEMFGPFKRRKIIRPKYDFRI